MKRIVSITLILSLMLCLLAGCGGPSVEAYVPTGDALVMEGEDPESKNPQVEEEPQELTLVYRPDRSMNPLEATDPNNRVLFSLIYQNLFNIDSEGNPEPILCKTFQASADGRKWTFYIETGATFSDGTFLTIHDVVATFEAALESSYYKGRFIHVAGVSLSDDGGITFTLNTPYDNFPQLLDVPILKSSQVASDNPLGTGPYALSSALSGSHLRRVVNWWCDRFDNTMTVTADIIHLIGAGSPTEVRDQFEFGDVGLVCTDPCSGTYADYRCDYELWDIDNGTFLYLGCNVAWVDFLEKNTLRSMLTYGIDRDTIVKECFGGYAQATTLPVSPSSPYYSPSLANRYAYDSNKFVNFLSQYGKTKEPIRLLVNSSDSNRVQVARFIAQSLTDFGLPTETLEYNTQHFKNAIVAGNYDLYLGVTRLSVNMDLSAFFKPWGELSRNGVSDPVTYSLCQESLANSGNYRNLHEQVCNDARIIPIAFYRYSVYATRGLLTDLTPVRDNIFCYSLGKTLQAAQIPTDYD